MITENLFDSALIEPVRRGADTLFVVSGYATAAMTFHHFESLRKSLGKLVKINLIVGMCPYDGLSLSNHRAFQQLATNDFPSNFTCSYVTVPPQVHSKAYAWYKDKEPIIGFVGSANYTQNAFSKSQREVLVMCDPAFGYDYFSSLERDSVYCTHNEIENYIQVYRDTYQGRKKKEQLQKQGVELIVPEQPDLQDLPAVRVSFLDRYGDLPQRSGLNWGQRPEQRREPNQAYIKLPSSVYNTDFFPSKAVHFTVLTDDNKVLICTSAQQTDKAIHTPHNNSLIGEYFRYRLGVPSGHPVTKTDLLRYGRTDVDFYKIDDETYFMDFSVR
jgi:hypothetical protein